MAPGGVQRESCGAPGMKFGVRADQTGSLCWISLYCTTRSVMNSGAEQKSSVAAHSAACISSISHQVMARSLFPEQTHHIVRSLNKSGVDTSHIQIQFCHCRALHIRSGSFATPQRLNQAQHSPVRRSTILQLRSCDARDLSKYREPMLRYKNSPAPPRRAISPCLAPCFNRIAKVSARQAMRPGDMRECSIRERASEEAWFLQRLPQGEDRERRSAQLIQPEGHQDDNLKARQLPNNSNAFPASSSRAHERNVIFLKLIACAWGATIVEKPLGISFLPTVRNTIIRQSNG
jgi:hypothetical protein